MKGHYGNDFKAKIKLNDYVDLATEEFLVPNSKNLITHLNVSKNEEIKRYGIKAINGNLWDIEDYINNIK